MRTASSRLHRAMREQRAFEYDVIITCMDGTVLELGMNDLVQAGSGISYSGGGGSLALGNAYCGCLKISIFNFDDQYEEIDFYGAKITVTASMTYEDDSTETLNLGTFTVTEPEQYGVTITITAYDDMYKADRPFDTSQLVFPLTAQELYRQACSQAVLSPLSTDFPNNSYICTTAPENVTCRQVIGMCAMLAGGNAVITDTTITEGNETITNSYVRIIPYDQAKLSSLSYHDGGVFDDGTPVYETGDDLDGGTFNPWSTGDDVNGGTFAEMLNVQLFTDPITQIVSTDDIVITGIRVKAGGSDGETYGSDGYVLAVENELAAGKELEAATLIGTILNGMTFRACEVTIPCYPLTEIGDVVFLENKGKLYASWVTDLEFGFGGVTRIKCSADSPVRNSTQDGYKSASSSLRQLRSLLEDEITDREQAVRDLTTAIAAKSGLYTTEEVQQDQSVIYYMHDKPELANSHVVWKMTSDAFAVTNNYQGDQTVWLAGLTVNGALVAQALSTVGLNFDWGVGGTLVIEDQQGNETLYANATTGVVRINAQKFKLDGRTTNSWVGDGEPTASNYPAVDWVTTDEKDEHLDNIYYDNREAGIYKYSYMYQGLELKYEGTLNYSGSGDSIQITFKHNDKWYVIKNPFPVGNFKKTIFIPNTYVYNNRYCTFHISVADGVTYDFNYTITVAEDEFPDAEEYGATPPFSGYSVVYRGINTNIHAVKSRTDRDIILLRVDATIDASTGFYAWKNMQAKYSQEDVFNTLTNGGLIQGIYMENGQLYINFSYAKGGTLVLGDTNNGRGSLSVLNTSGAQTTTIDKDGIKSHSGNTITTIADGAINVYNGNTYYGTIQVYIPQIVGESGGVNLFSPYSVRLSVGSSLSASPTAELQLEGSQILITEGTSLIAQDIKSRLVADTVYGDRLLYCYETPTPYFGDIGTGQTDETGVAIVDIDDIFDETVNTEVEYCVFLQKEGRGDLWVAEKDRSFFVVEGTPNLKFSWELKAVQKNFEMLRLDDMEMRRSGDILMDDIEQLLNEELADFDRSMEEL